MVLTIDEQFVLDQVKFDEQNKLRKETWVIPAPFTERAAAGMLGWYLAAPPEVRNTWAGPAEIPDVDRAKPILDRLVELGLLVVLGEVTFPYFAECAGVVYHEYATPGFAAKFEGLWKGRRHETWEKAHPNVSIFPNR